MNTTELQPSPADPPPLGEKIKQVRIAHKLTQKDFAKSLGIAQGFLCAIERGRKKPSDTLLIALRHTYNVDGQWLWDDSCPPGQQSPLAANRTPCMTPLLHCSALLPERPATTGTGEQISLPDIPDHCFAITYSGDFMSPTIRHGDIVIIAPDETPMTGNIVLITGQWDEPFLRRYRSKGGEMYFTADNSAYTPFKKNESTRILGVVISVWRRINV